MGNDVPNPVFSLYLHGHIKAIRCKRERKMDGATR